jgi:hypothetical protein
MALFAYLVGLVHASTGLHNHLGMWEILAHVVVGGVVKRRDSVRSDRPVEGTHAKVTGHACQEKGRANGKNVLISAWHGGSAPKNAAYGSCAAV